MTVVGATADVVYFDETREAPTGTDELLFEEKEGRRMEIERVVKKFIDQICEIFLKDKEVQSALIKIGSEINRMKVEGGGKNATDRFFKILYGDKKVRSALIKIGSEIDRMKP